jgi:hypothetical protein
LRGAGAQRHRLRHRDGTQDRGLASGQRSRNTVDECSALLDRQQCSWRSSWASSTSARLSNGIMARALIDRRRLATLVERNDRVLVNPHHRHGSTTWRTTT